MDRGKPIGVPALILLYHSMSQSSAPLRELDASIQLPPCATPLRQLERDEECFSPVLPATSGHQPAQKVVTRICQRLFPPFLATLFGQNGQSVN